MFDLASNTKMYAVNFALQHLVSTGKLDLNKNISHYLSDFNDHPEDDVKGKNRLRVIDLLHHHAGFLQAGTITTRKQPDTSTLSHGAKRLNILSKPLVI